MLSLKGGQGNLRSIGLKLKALAATAQIQSAISQNCAEAILDLVKEGVSNEQDPYGKSWPKLVLRAGKIGKNTGGMVQSLHLSKLGKSGFTVAFGKHYATFFHGGTGIYGPTGRPIRPKVAKVLAFSVRGAKGFKGSKKGKGTKQFAFRSVKGSPPRPLLPEGSLPETWRREIMASADEAMRQYFK
jgi:hypothetical protein